MTNTEIAIADFKPNQEFYEDLKGGKFVLVLGAGFSYGIKNSTSKHDLPKEFNIHYDTYKNIPVSKNFNQLTNLLFNEEENIDKYQAAANLWEDANYILKGNDLTTFFRNLFIPDKVEFVKAKHEEYRSILFPSWHGIYTFNFDTVFETIVELEKKEPYYYSKWFPEHRGILPKKKETHIAHLHGIITSKNLNELVFSTEGYNRLRREVHTLYDTLHNDANENLKLFIVGTQFDEEPIDDKFFDSLKNDVTIYHFDRKNNDFRTKPKIRNNPNYHFIKINDIIDVLLFLKTHQDKIENNNFTQYLNNIITNENISKVDQLYVNLFGQEELTGLQTDSIAIELLNEEFATSYSSNNYHQKNDVLISNKDEQKDSIDIIENETSDEFEVEEKKRIPRVDSILNIEQETQRFIIVGAPGSGKTTTLKKILFLNANRINKENSQIKIPVLIFANEYKKDRNFRKIISERLGIEDCEALLHDGRLQLLIDGINEIDLDQKKQAYRELTGLINDYKGIAVIITTRKTGFRNEFNIPVYELKELQESEIKEFIHKRVPDKLESIWSQLEVNKNLLELAYNPLYLSMIVIASKEGHIPINRGALFDSFVRELLIREKLDNTDLDSIIDILAEFAFYLKKAGMVSVPKEKAEQIIIDRIKSIHDFHSPFDLLAKVTICNLVSISSNTAFIHEAFLDYFAAVKIKINFNSLFNNEIIRNDDIGIKDITEPIWYEPLILCGDLFKEKEEETQATNYFELLYKGILKNNYQIKRIEDLSTDDWNSNLKIPCKIAFNLKHIYPLIYLKAEQYLSNYMTLWHLNYRKSIETIPLEKLFEAIASLSSDKLLEKIIYNDSWQEVWLYSPNDDPTETSVSEIKYVFTNRSYLKDAIVKNISDFDTLCKLLFDDEKLDSCVFPILKGRVGEIKSALLRSTSVANIKHTYLNKVKDLDLLKFISYVDPNFFISNYNRDLWGINEFIDQLNEIIRFDVVRVELINNILFLEETQQTRIIINFLKHKYFKPILEYLNSNIEIQNFSNKNIKQIKLALKLVPIEIIPEKVKDYFFSRVDIFSANYEFIKYA
ncbi:MAG: NACHT domain-containing protein [Prolixibacteraceae bacterium]|nr:NACHT domain-containing protein [Prolixibacteraceae bacterium]